MPEKQANVWRKLSRDFFTPSRSQVIIAVVLLLCSFAMVAHVKSRAEDETYTSLRRTELVAMLDDLTRQSRSLDSEIDSLEATKRQLQSGVDAREIAVEEAARRTQNLEILAGTIPARGPGIRVVIYDPDRRMAPDVLLNAIEELRDAGGEVVEVNDSVRLVASSWVTSKDNQIVIDGHTLAAPYVIKVIGDPDTLAEAARFRGGLISTVEGERVGGSVNLTKEDELEITSLHEPAPLRFAGPE